MGITIQSIIEGLIAPVGKLEQTCDTLKCGNPDTEVTGIVVAFMPTQYVIEQAIARGANFIISHEGPFFSNHDDCSTLVDDPVYQKKRNTIDESGIALFRFHDYWHRYKPDGIMAGLLQELNWTSFVQEHYAASTVLQFPKETVRGIAEQIKNRLGIQYVRVQGDPDTVCSKIGLLAGYRGLGQRAIPFFEQDQLDLIIYGEGPEWETPEYVRDAIYQGKHKALIVLGHAESEEPGMKHLANLLSNKYSEIPVFYVKERSIFQII
ncbi:Nif3-like dinuclear metal center hexameric protein [Paenibacillus contaminans]|uniref:GTP cyclohydrolase 1 type 2 homolog n=1 Tax=Paenibacillus contaminans TaxID=450362 RepID=A0A329LRW9_9BACL|nr:Nif3-like dinuclear metal center hexameric protein [Paenibacillus contaminans]RAV09906.1 transcriptional regulator [Paenibacillus contaminans]